MNLINLHGVTAVLLNSRVRPQVRAPQWVSPDPPHGARTQPQQTFHDLTVGEGDWQGTYHSSNTFHQTKGVLHYCFQHLNLHKAGYKNPFLSTNENTKKTTTFSFRCCFKVTRKKQTRTPRKSLSAITQAYWEGIALKGLGSGHSLLWNYPGFCWKPSHDELWLIFSRTHCFCSTRVALSGFIFGEKNSLTCTVRKSCRSGWLSIAGTIVHAFAHERNQQGKQKMNRHEHSCAASQPRHNAWSDIWWNWFSSTLLPWWLELLGHLETC